MHAGGLYEAEGIILSWNTAHLLLIVELEHGHLHSLVALVVQLVCALQLTNIQHTGLEKTCFFLYIKVNTQMGFTFMWCGRI